MTAAISNDGKQTEALCLACGLCCNGVLFADVKLQAEDNPETLRGLGLELLSGAKRAQASTQSSAGPLKFLQPCTAYSNCRCRIYAARPQYCRSFECLLLKSVNMGKTSHTRALEMIRTAQQRADTVRQLLRELGDHDEHLALAGRFRRMSRRMQKRDLDEQTAELFGQLTLAVHALNLQLSQAFYP